MRRVDRLFEIIQLLRARERPTTAAELADRLEVTVRTIYRDVAALQAQRVPIDGEAGIGYVMRRGYDLPPLMFTAEEVDAIGLGVRLLRRLRDAKLQRAADSVLSKLTVTLPQPLRAALAAPPVYVSDGSAPPAPGIDLAAVREAIRARQKIDIAYVDEQGRRTRRKIWPIAIAYYVDVTLIGAWCELRSDYRHFRTDRIAYSAVLDEVFPADNGRLMAEWLALRKERENPS